MQGSLPLDVQVDLLFPRNDTYASTQYSPIVFGMQNLDAIWPLNIWLDGISYGMGSKTLR